MSNNLESKTITGTVKEIYKIPINGSTIDYMASIVVITGSYFDEKGRPLYESHDTVRHKARTR